MSDKSSEKDRVSKSIEAHNLLLEVAGPQASVKQVLLAAHRKLAKHDWSFNRVRDVYHKDPRIRIRADELAQLRLLADAKQQTAGHDELQKIRARVARLEQELLRISASNVAGD